MVKTAIFVREAPKCSREIYDPVLVLLDGEDECVVPSEVLRNDAEFSIGVLGVDGDKRLPTNLLRFRANASCYQLVANSAAPSLTVYEQIINALASKQDKLIAGENIIIEGNIIRAINTDPGASLIYNADTKDDFPIEGDKSMLYKAIEEKKLYQWNPDTNSYEELTSGVSGGGSILDPTNVELIFGGTASGNN